jgi:hypothetical protein
LLADQAGGAESGLLASLPHRVVMKRTEVMVKRIAVSIVSFCLLGACGAFCQDIGSLGGMVQGSQIKGTNSAEVQRQQRSAGISLPDAPSAVGATQIDQFGRKGYWLLKVGWDGVNAGVMRGTELDHVAPLLVYEAVPAQKESGEFFRKYLEPSLSNRHLRYQASAKASWMGRATDAASRILVTRDESGRQRLNGSYFLGVLTSVAVHSASRPYWARSNSVPLGDFGSTVGNDAGMNLMHEFGPGLRQAVTGHMPGFVFKIEERMIRDRTKEVASSPAR